jgi:S-DNA-T family DNA segregation ATPase FtsK/SpoIIIE
MNWKANQSQAGAMLDQEIKSSNLFGKLGDWLGNIFIFDSIGIAAFIVAFLFLVLGFQILKKPYFKLWKTLSHSLFFICWLPIFMGAIIKGDGTLSGVFGNEIQDYLASIIGNFGLWVTLIVAIALYFILEFNLRPSSIQAKYDAIKDKFSTEEYDADEDFEADKELQNLNNDEKVDFENLQVTSEVEIPKNDTFETIKTPNQTSFDNTKPIVETLQPVVSTPVNIPVEKDLEQVGLVSKRRNCFKTKEDIAFSIEEQKEDLDDFDKKAKELVDKHGFMTTN